MRKSVLFAGIIVLVIGFVLLVLGGANPPKIPLIYGSNQTYWMLFSVVGLIIVIVGLILKKK